MSGNPRWMYTCKGTTRQLVDFTPLLRSLPGIAAADSASREQRRIERTSRSDARGSGKESRAGVRVPAARVTGLAR